MSKLIVIVGQGPRSFQHPENAEVWVINGPRFPPRWDVLFQLHGLDHIEHKHGREFLGKLAYIDPPKRLIMTAKHQLLPAAEPFPLTEVMGSCGTYLTGSFALVLAYALILKPLPHEIILDGVMFAGGPAQWGAGEGWAVPCIEFHLGRAYALGIHTKVPPGCGLFERRDFVYGFQGPGCV